MRCRHRVAGDSEADRFAPVPTTQPAPRQARRTTYAASLASRSLCPHGDVESIARAAGWRDGQLWMKRDLEIDVDAAGREEAIDIGIVERLHSHNVSTGGEPRDLKRPALSE